MKVNKKKFIIFFSLLCTICFIIFIFLFLKKTVIHTIITIDNNYTYPALVSMTSMLENTDKKTCFEVHVLVSDSFTDENKNKLKKIEEIYKNCKISFVCMENEFSNAPLEKHFTVASYYRLAIPKLFPDLKRCIYLDVDTIILKDLTNLANINIGKNYIGAAADAVRAEPQQDKKENYREFLGIPNLDQCINSGVLLWNLDECRKDTITEKFKAFIESKNDEKIPSVDQSVIDAVCYGKILTLPFKFNVQTYLYFSGKQYGEDDYSAKICNEKEWNEAWNDPFIIHYAGDKPWKASIKFEEKWWEYAQKTPCWDAIKEEYKTAYNKFQG
ncbi:MAG: glycosyltransferase family 8 protein [Oscillospiraceae bacterium]|nr:glycosyltransferase family 8 protein [Oscillospiraceae bacterium]